MADTMVLPETQKLYEQQDEITELQAYANMLNTPDVDGRVGEVTDITAVMRVRYNEGSSTRIHTSSAFNKYFAEFVKANAPELVSRTVQKALELVKEQRALAAQEVLEQLNITGANSTLSPVQEGAPVFTGSMQAVGYAGEPISHYVNAASLPVSVITFEAEDLPAGLTLDKSTGLLTGTLPEAGTYGVTIKATNDKGTTNKVLSLIIAERTGPNIAAPTAPVIYGQLDVRAIKDKEFVFQCAGMNIPAGSTWTLTPDLSSTIPGLMFDPTKGKISGTPTNVTATPQIFELKVTTPNGDEDTAVFKVSVDPDVPNVHGPSIYAIASQSVTAGNTFSYQCGGLNITPGAVWTMSGAPVGLTINSTGMISGTATVAGTYTIDVTVTLLDSSTATQSFDLVVATLPTSAPVITAGQTFNGNEGTSFDGTIACDQSGATFVLDSGSNALPLSLTLGTDGKITGTPDTGTAGTHTITVVATKDGQTSTPETVTIVIAA